MNKKAILIVSFGSSLQQAREKAIFSIEAAIAEAFENYAVESAFTSNHIRAKLKQEGIQTRSAQEALQKLIERGYEEIYIQPLHILAGFEYEKIQAAVAEVIRPELKICLGKPLISSEVDVSEVIEALKGQFPINIQEQQVVLVGHGTDHSANEVYKQLQMNLLEKKIPVLVGTIEEGVGAVIKKLDQQSIKEVILMPFLLVAGDHVMNDLMGVDDSSWKSRLFQSGYKVEVYNKGLGENMLIQQIYVKRLKSHIEKGALN